MTEKSLDEALQEFRINAHENGLSGSFIERNVVLITAPIASGEAVGTAYRWFNAPIGDPIHQRTLNDIADLFSNAKDEWDKSLAAADGIWDDITNPMNLEKVCDISRGFDWMDWRARLLDEVDPKHPKAHHIQATTDSFIHLAKKGLVREALTEPIRELGLVARDNSSIYSELTQAGVVGVMRKRRNWDDYWEGASDGLMAGGGLMGVACFAGVAGAGAGAAAIGCAVMAGYGIGKLIRNW
jgi:hypothetical protein